MRLIKIALLPFLLSACSFADQPYSLPQYAAWTNQKIAVLTKAWGRPLKIDTAWSGNWVYYYQDPAHKACTLMFEINPNDIILNVRSNPPCLN